MTNTMTISIGQLVRDRTRVTSKFGLVVGPSKRAGKLRISHWQDGEHWRAPVAVDAGRLEPIGDLTILPLTVAKHLTAAIFERDYLSRVLERAQGSVKGAARLAAVDRTNFRRLLQRHRLR